MTQTIKLQYPITLPDKRVVDAITLRRPKVRDLKIAQARSGDDAVKQETTLLALLSAEKLVPEDMEELDLADYGAIQSAFQRMLAVTGSDTGGGSAAGAVVSVSTE